jgi:hypothetical protein
MLDPGSARVAARLTDDTPLLLEKQQGEGHVLLLASGLENLTNDLPLHPIFVAFVDRTARYLSGTEGLSGSMLVDSYLQLRSAAEPVGASTNVEVIDPDGRRPLSLSEARAVQSIPLQRAGFYQFRFASGRDAVIGVNPDRRESNLQPMADDMQRLWTGNSGGAAAHQAKSSGVVAAAAEENYRQVKLWWYVMVLALLVALVETVLASGYLGTQREEV